MSRAGATLAETLAALAVTVLLLGVAAEHAVGTIAALRGVVREAGRSAAVARLDAVLTRACGRVEQPVDLSAPMATVTRWPAGSGPATTSIGYLDGVPEAALVLRRTDRGTEVRVGDELHVFGAVRVERVEVVRAPIPHLSVRVASGPNRATIVAPFGQFPPP